MVKWARDLKSGDPELPLNLFEMVSRLRSLTVKGLDF